jgi:hypothetical protein
LHKHGACVGIQLNHAGASAYAYRLNGEMPLSSSQPSKKNGNIPRPMTHDEIIMRSINLVTPRSAFAARVLTAWKFMPATLI